MVHRHEHGRAVGATRTGREKLDICGCCVRDDRLLAHTGCGLLGLILDSLCLWFLFPLSLSFVGWYVGTVF